MITPAIADTVSAECRKAAAQRSTPTQLLTQHHRWEVLMFAVLITLLNLPLLAGGFSPQFIFLPAAMKAGEYWRLVTHPFVHVSVYHLGCDAAAFLFAYAELRNHRWFERLGAVTAAGTGSLLVALWITPEINEIGLCGLSGIAHGLVALVGLELLERSKDKFLRYGGLFCFLIVVAKAASEAITGQVLFAEYHLGSVGIPVAVCHTGGVLGALVATLIFRARQRMMPG